MARSALLNVRKKWFSKSDLSTEISLKARWLVSRRDILRAQRLRCRTFSEEFGIRISPFGIDRDRFDKHCLHLGVEDLSTGTLVGYTRIMTGEAARKLGRFYSSGEFELNSLWRLPGNVVEVGRTCVHPDYRNGATIVTLWSALSRFLVTNRIDFLIGCASVSMADGGAGVAGIMNRLRSKHMTDAMLRVQPKVPVPEFADLMDSHTMPPLLKAYLRMGAKIAGEPCWDTEFNCADLFILLQVSQMSARYRDHFIAKAG